MTTDSRRRAPRTPRLRPSAAALSERPRSPTRELGPSFDDRVQSARLSKRSVRCSGS